MSTRKKQKDTYGQPPEGIECPDKASGKRCAYPICDHFCGAPPKPIFGEAAHV